jgi:hypothetical protein
MIDADHFPLAMSSCRRDARGGLIGAIFLLRPGAACYKPAATITFMTGCLIQS